MKRRLINRTDQPLLIARPEANPLHLLPGAAAVLEEDEAASAQVQALVAAGALESRPFTVPSAAVRAAAAEARREADPAHHKKESTSKKKEE